MRIIYIFLLVNFYLFSQEVNIRANKVIAKKSENFAHFIGKVSMVKGDDTLVCDDLMVYTKEENNETIAYKYVAVGNVAFTIKRKDGLVIGNGDKVIYDLDKKRYTIIGNGYLENKAKGSVVKGDKIYVDELSGNTQIEGKQDKPVELKFKVKK